MTEYLHLPDYTDILVAMIPKCGSNTVRQAMKGFKTVSVEDSDDYQIRVAFIRDPIDRFLSAYSMYYWYPQHAIPREYEDFVDFVLSGGEDGHTTPYTKQFPNITHPHKLIEIREVWGKYFDTPNIPGWHNALKRVGGGDYRIDDLHEFYARDLELWRSL